MIIEKQEDKITTKDKIKPHHTPMKMLQLIIRNSIMYS